MPVLVIDEHSSDRTRDIAVAHGAVVIERDWTGFVDARRYALSQVHTPWMFALDADESLDPAMHQAIAALPDDGNGYWVSRDTYFCGKPLRMWRAERLLRLMRVAGARVQAHPAADSDAQLHETYVCDGPTGLLPGTLLHFSYPDVASYRAKYAEYTDIEARGQPQPARANVAIAMLRFAHAMLFRGALLDGPAGWYVAWKSATYALVVARKAGKR
jgi:glycosyltransferase involved in cell wall biosynthesis